MAEQLGNAANPGGAGRCPDDAVDTSVFVGRQPILDLRQQVFAYELLFRSSRENCYGGGDGDAATRATVNTSLNVVGLTDLVAGRKAFINITRQLLLDDFYAILPAEHFVVELLENIEPDPDVVDACRRLKRAGYTLALDDFVFDVKYEPLIRQADLIKVDLMQTPVAQCGPLLKRCASSEIRFLAEKVETQDEFEQAQAAGFELFQGYYFAKPEIVEGRDLPSSKQGNLSLLREASAPRFDLGRIERVIKSEPSLPIKLLRYINSAAHGIRNDIDSVRRALMMLGERPVRKWAALVAGGSLAEDAPKELLRNCLVRAAISEKLADDLGMSDRSFDLFLFGLLSSMDAILRVPMPRIIESLALADDVRGALLGESNRLGTLRQLTVALERVDTVEMHRCCRELSLDDAAVLEAYQDAIHWADDSIEI
jgi:c-di-GMP-related signal transduction protein